MLFRSLDFLVTLSAGTTASEQPLWESYLDWLRLILSHFNAVENLTSYITNTHYKDLDLKILISPPMLTTSPTFSLLKLFQQHPYLLPDDTDEVNIDKVENKDKDGNGDWNNVKMEDEEKSEDKSNMLLFKKAVVKLLLFVWSSQPDIALSDVKHLRSCVRNIEKGIAKGLDDNTFDKMLNSMKSITACMVECTLPGWKECTNEMIVNFDNLGTVNPEDIGNTESPINAINNTFNLLQARAPLYMKMVMDEKAKVCGPLHCEASLTSLLMLLQCAVDGKYDTLISNLEVTYTIVF